MREAAPRRQFSLIGLTWQGAEPDSIELRTRSVRGSWSSWQTLDQQDGGPDRRQSPKTTEPLWTGPATRVQVRAVRAGRPATDELTLVAIDPGTSTNDTQISQLSAAGSGISTMPTVVTRAQWGADESLMTWAPEYATTTKAAALHHTADSNDYTCDQSAALVRGIYYYHSVTNGWGDIGYNALVDKCGTIFEGRTGGLNLPAIGAHTGGFNRHVFGISMIGDYDAVSPSTATLESVSQMIAWKLTNSYVDPLGSVTLVSVGGGTSKYAAGAPVTLPTIFAHRDVGRTSCPGNFGYNSLSSVRDRTAQLAGDWRSGAIHQKWQALGGENVAGPVYAVETNWPEGGRATVFGSGWSTIAWRSDLAAHWVQGDIHATYNRLGGPSAGVYPTTDELATPDGVGRYNHFTHSASIYWTPDTGAHVVHGAIRNTWAASGWETGTAGYPTTDELSTPDTIGRYNHFTKNASIYWTPDTGAHLVYGAIRDHWSALGWETSWLGYPTSDEYPVTGGRRSDFQGGYIEWNAATGIATEYRQ
ncbi:N-acetylmuramoyl-L-alanine amidase [Saccharopolyspora sp. 5N102]|uniref:N-acetylmuramoyl-L-alanine amidase n=1 Tax=Saccharopolyspora sp. 5N102 TaxID=3375155 RepID=UPI003798259D